MMAACVSGLPGFANNSKAEVECGIFRLYSPEGSVAVEEMKRWNARGDASRPMKIDAENVTCVRGGRTVFADISFTLSSGEALLLSGPNGAGKTSLLRILAGFIQPESGSVELHGGHDDLALSQHSHYVGHANAVKPALTVEENLAFWVRYNGGIFDENDLLPFDLMHHAAIPAALLSAGQRRRLTLSRLTAIARPIWFLDEPTVGLDKASTKALCDVMRPHLAEGGMIIASSHVEIGIEFNNELELQGRVRP